MPAIVTRPSWKRGPSLLDLVFGTAEKKTPKASKQVEKPEVAHPKDRPVVSEPYRRLVAALPCALCDIEKYSQAAHPPPTGKSIKEDDRECFPLCGPHPVGRDMVEGCHVQFDQYRHPKVPKDKTREVARKLGRRTRLKIIADGAWPKRLPRLPEGKKK